MIYRELFKIKKNIYLLYLKNYFLVEDFKKILEQDQKYNVIFLECSLYKVNILLRFIRKIHFLSPFYYKTFWLKTEKEKIALIKKEDLVIFFDIYSKPYLELSRKIKGEKKLWLWNSVTKESLRAKKYFNKIYTFDKFDSLRYRIQYLNQFYWRKYENKKIENKYDIFFVGQDKNRIKIIEQFDREINLKKYFYVIEDKSKIYESKYLKYLKSKYLSYEKTVELIEKSKCLLEINKSGQVGLTLRSLEALFYGKKLITNNEDIKNYDFYNENNIYIFNEKEIKTQEILDFLSRKSKKIDKKILKKYTINFWLERISES